MRVRRNQAAGRMSEAAPAVALAGSAVGPKGPDPDVVMIECLRAQGAEGDMKFTRATGKVPAASGFTLVPPTSDVVTHEQRAGADACYTAKMAQ